MTRPAAKPGAGQRRAVERARELAEAAATVQTLGAYLGVSTQHPGQLFYAAYPAAVDRLRDLLASIDQAGGGQADRGGIRLGRMERLGVGWVPRSVPEVMRRDDGSRGRAC